MVHERLGHDFTAASSSFFTPRSAGDALGLAELARKVESERLAIYRAQIGVDGPRALDGKSYSELSLGVI